MPPKLAYRAPTGRPVTLAPEGIVTAICAVTGVTDEVNDCIVPGAFGSTLAKRKVKAVWAHSWPDPIGRVLSAEEWKPGDRRLPKRGPDGKAWPAEAGALVATFQFNLRTERGRDAFEFVRSWAEAGEACFSIGYKVMPGLTSKRADGVRMIYGLELFECSPVLHGAHPMTMALEVKSAAGAVAAAREGIETKATPLVEVKTAEPMAGDGVMVALYPPPDVAEKVAVPDGSAPSDLHVTLAFLGTADDLAGDPQELAGTLAGSVAGGPLEGSIGGLGLFPAGDSGVPAWVPVDVAGLSELYVKVVEALRAAGESPRTDHGFTPHMTLGYDLGDVAPVDPVPVTFDTAYLVAGQDKYPIPLAGAPVTDQGGDVGQAPMQGKAAEAVAEALAYGDVEVKASGGADRNRGNAENLRKWFTEGAGAVKIAWGTDGDFSRCVALAAKHMTPENAKGYCNLRHHDALGMYPATHAKLDRAHEAKANPAATSAKAAVADAVTRPTTSQTETKTMPYMEGSYEERRDDLREAVQSLLFPEAEQDPDGPPRGYASIQATFDDRVIVDSCSGSGDEDTWEIPYSVTDGLVSLGAPKQVALTLVASATGEEMDEENAEEAAETARFVDPALSDLVDAAQRLTRSPIQGKALTDRVTVPLLALLDALAVKGVDVAGMILPDDEEEDTPTGGPDAEDPESGDTADGLDAEPDDAAAVDAASSDAGGDTTDDEDDEGKPEGKALDGGLVELDANEVLADLAGILA